MDKARAQELLANERARLERLLRAEIAATAPDTGDDVDDANWRIAEETGRAVRRSLAALADREENADDSRRTRGARRTEEAEGTEDVEGTEEGEDLDVEALDDGELIDEEETPADFEGEADDVEVDEVDEESEEAGEAKQAEEEAEERPPQRRRSGRG